MTRGLNGETVFAAENVHVGYVDGQNYGYRGLCPVTVDVQMERLDGRDTYETTDHRQVSRPVDFAMTAAVWRPNGADHVASGGAAEILGALTEFAPGWNAAKAGELAALAPLHLNGMNAGCDHQTPVMETDRYGREVASLDLTPPCPETGYRYGSAWLLRDLPAEPPTARDVLRCLADDAAGYENARDLYDWASEYGFEDERQARRTYDLIGGQTAELRAFLGARYDAYVRGEA